MSSSHWASVGPGRPILQQMHCFSIQLPLFIYSPHSLIYLHCTHILIHSSIHLSFVPCLLPFICSFTHSFFLPSIHSLYIFLPSIYPSIHSSFLPSSFPFIFPSYILPFILPSFHYPFIYLPSILSSIYPSILHLLLSPIPHPSPLFPQIHLPTLRDHLC